jgi:membrane-bound lytic murein transglycosylase B
MGHTQFMPTSYLRHAVDFRGDGRRDIWSDDPTDALASTAAYLAGNGWVSGQPWAVEVTLPQGFDLSQSGKGLKMTVADWRARGIRVLDGRSLQAGAMASVLLPAGVNGPSLLVFDNFHVIASYNASDSYVIGVGHLADRLRGVGSFQAAWPRGDRPLSLAERTELQERLTNAGYDTGGADGKLGANTTAALRQWQIASGMPADGYPSARVLERLR